MMPRRVRKQKKRLRQSAKAVHASVSSYSTVRLEPKPTWKKSKKNAILENPLLKYLHFIFGKFNSLGNLKIVWPKQYRSTLHSDGISWRNMLFSLNTESIDHNKRMTDYVKQYFRYLCNRNWVEDVWILASEELSEIFTHEVQYQMVMQHVKQIAADEKHKFSQHFDNIITVIRESPWYNICQHLMPLLTNEEQQCKIILLFFAIAGQEKVNILNYLTDFVKVKVKKHGIQYYPFVIRRVNTFYPPHSHFLMTEERWNNLMQVIELLIQKRSIMRMLSNDFETRDKNTTDLEQHATTNNYETQLISIENKKEDLPFNIKTESHVTIKETDTINDAECIKVKQETDTTNDIDQEPNTTFVTKFISIKNEPKTEICADIESNNHFVKQEPTTEETKELTVNIKEEPIEEVNQTNFPAPCVIKTEIKDVERSSTLQDKEIESGKDSEPLSSLDKLILQFNMKQLNSDKISSVNNTECVDISDDDDCIIDEDNKLGVTQLLDMYREIVTAKQSKLVFNPMAGQNKTRLLKKEKSKKMHRFVVPHAVPLKRNPSVPSSKLSSHSIEDKNMKSSPIKSELSGEGPSSSSSSENTVIVLDDTLTPRKRKKTLSPHNRKAKKGRYFMKNLPDDATPVRPIEAQDGDCPPIHCSTPIIDKKTDPNFIPVTKQSRSSNKSQIENFNEDVVNVTKEINRDSYLTIDLTSGSLNCSSISKVQNAVIDLDTSAENGDCTIVSNDSLSISGESDVTVLNMPQSKNRKQMRKFEKGISKLDAAEKGRLLELITKNIFNACEADKNKENDVRASSTRATETAEDSYIKEVILGQAPSRNSIGSNIYNPERDEKNKTGLRMIVIDGSNVAMSHGQHRTFSVKGLKICIDYFLRRGHVVKAFVPRFRCKFGKSTEPRVLDELEKRGLVVYTPSREVQGRTITPYDDRYIVQCAAEFDGVIVSGDNYRDLLQENPRWRFVIENRLLPFTWVNDMIMFPKDPLGRNGPPLEYFLRHTMPNPNQQRR